MRPGALLLAYPPPPHLMASLASVYPASITRLSSPPCPGLQSPCPTGSLPSLASLVSQVSLCRVSISRGSILSILGSSTETDFPEVSCNCDFVVFCLRTLKLDNPKQVYV